MNIWRIEGFGIDGDFALVEATDAEHARASLADVLQARGVDFNHTDTWSIVPAERPLMIVSWQS